MKKNHKLRDFFISLGNYVLLGLKQMYGYLQNYTGLFVIGGIATTIEGWITFKTIIKNKKLKNWRRWTSSIFIFLSIVAFWGVILLFLNQPWLFDIHFNEYISRAFFVIGLIVGGYDILSVLLTTYPALLIHKGLVNKGNHLPIFDKRTDDPTGKTWGTTIFGKKIKVPRIDWKIRIVLAIISLIVFIATYNKPLYA